MSQSTNFSEELINPQLQDYLLEEIGDDVKNIFDSYGVVLLDLKEELIQQGDPHLLQQPHVPQVQQNNAPVPQLQHNDAPVPQLQHNDAPAVPTNMLQRSSVVSTDEYDGPFHFEVSVIPNSKNGKNTWVYSNELKKIFIEMGSSFPVDFKITGQPLTQLYIRAMPVFSSPQHSQDLVHRCIQHEQPMDKTNLDISNHIRQHVIRCQNTSAMYMGDRHKQEKLSVLIPLNSPQIGSDSVREMYVFLCMTSCPSGMNRRPIQVIFTLEDHRGEILGRKVMNARICSCPKRDKEKEEEVQNDNGSDGAHTTKKRKREKVVVNSYTHSPDTREHQLTLSIIGNHNVQSVLKYARDLMAGEALSNANSPPEAQFKKCYFKISAQLEAHSNVNTPPDTKYINSFLKKEK